MTDAIDFALPVLEGVSVLQEPEIGSVLEVENPGQLLAAARMTAALIRHDQQNVEGRRLMGDIRQFRQISGRLFYLFIPLSQGGELRVKLEDNRLLQDKLMLLSYLLEREDILRGSAGELDLSGETPYFRPDAN